MFKIQFKQSKLLVWGGILGLIIASLILFAIWPLVTQIQDNSATLLSEKNDAAVLKMQSDEIEHFKAVYQNYKPNLDKTDQLFVDPQNPVDFIKFLEDTAAISSVKAQISLVPSGSPKNQTMLTFQLLCNDNFLNILHFLESLENGPYLLEIKDISIKNADLDKTAKNYPSGNVSANFSINAFTK